MKFGLLLSICFAAVATIDKTPPAKTQVNSESAKTASTTFATDPCPIGDQR